MTFKEAITQVLETCAFGTGYDACDYNFGSALAKIIRPIANKYHFSSLGISTGYGRDDKKLSMGLSYNNDDSKVYAYIGKAMYFDIKRVKGKSHSTYWDSRNEYKVCSARTANGEFDDVDIDEFFKKLETTNPEIIKASETRNHIKVVAADHAELISNMTALMKQFMAIEDDNNRRIVLDQVKNNTGLYISCY